jgi:hypothetical protein
LGSIRLGPSDWRRVGATANTFEIAGARAEFDKEEFADTASPGTVLKARVIEISYSEN